MGPKIGYKFVRYSLDFVLTEIVITKFDWFLERSVLLIFETICLEVKVGCWQLNSCISSKCTLLLHRTQLKTALATVMKTLHTNDRSDQWDRTAVTYCRPKNAEKKSELRKKKREGVSFTNILWAAFCMKVFCATFLYLHFVL